MSSNGRPRRVLARLAAPMTVAALALTIWVAEAASGVATKRPAAHSGTIAYVSDRTGEDEIHLLHLKSMKSSRLTRNPLGPDRARAWSPDGESLAFNSRRKPDASQPDIHVVDVASGAVERVTRTPLEEQRAAWTRDGRFVVYQRGDFTAGFELWRTHVRTGKEGRLTVGDGSASFDVAPDPSPVSDLILLQTNRGAGGLFPFQIALREPGSKTPTVIPLKLDGSVDGPRWSPDGRRIVFAAAVATARRDAFFNLSQSVHAEPRGGAVLALAPTEARDRSGLGWRGRCRGRTTMHALAVTEVQSKRAA